MKPNGALLGIILLGFSVSCGSSQAADEPDDIVPVDVLRNGLISALGDSFEYLDGEVGRTDAMVGTSKAKRFWFAKVRAKKTGEFAFSYTISFDFAGRKTWRTPDKAVYVIPIKIGDLGTPRVLQPGAWGGSAWPHANVGDTLVIPIHIDRYRIGHTFAKVDRKQSPVAAFFSTLDEERQHKRYMKLAAARPVVRSDAGDWVDLLASWHSAIIDRPGINAHHWLTAYLEFKKAGEVGLCGRLADADIKATTGKSSFRVYPKDKPVTVIIEYFHYTQHRGDVRFKSSDSIPAGTLQVRVGDRVVVGCGGYTTPAPEIGAQSRMGVVTTQPFKNVAAFVEEPRE